MVPAEHDIVENQDMLVIRGSYEATHTGEFLGVPATGRRVEAEIREPPLAGIGLDPVSSTVRLLRPEKDVDGAVRILREVGFARRQVGRALIGDHWSACYVVIKRDRPELSDRWIRWHAHAIGLAAVEPVTVLVLLGFEIDLSETEDAALHAGRFADRLVEPRAALVELRVPGCFLI